MDNSSRRLRESADYVRKLQADHLYATGPTSIAGSSMRLCTMRCQW
ncbi:hypothetical protein NRB56_64020 [Nocardia sp. RB56]|uniref:Uncharacterized protein n=1 Tax=Nocardia aurantia TaxID=2585199 RepID=A0A7K0DZ17_9NOCA|nr:hypothetical protein [Nocardia aurantia]